MRRILVVSVLMITYVLILYKFPHAMIGPGELVQGHYKITNNCFSCHLVFQGIPNKKCIACHKVDDIGKSADTNKTKQKVLFHSFLVNELCTSCHSDHNGLNPERSYSGFRHELFSESVRSQCSGCHEKPIDNLHKQIAAECNSCHTSEGWKSNVRFDHDLIQVAGRSDCASCHPIPTDDYHSSFKDNCSKCHNTTQWIPSTFDHSAYFVLDNDHNVKCSTCHNNNNFTTYSCYGCHDHSESNIREEHTEEGISDFSNCISCHKSGNKHDIDLNGRKRNNSEQNEQKNSSGSHSKGLENDSEDDD